MYVFAGVCTVVRRDSEQPPDVQQGRDGCSGVVGRDSQHRHALGRHRTGEDLSAYEPGETQGQLLTILFFESDPMIKVCEGFYGINSFSPQKLVFFVSMRSNTVQMLLLLKSWPLDQCCHLTFAHAYFLKSPVLCTLFPPSVTIITLHF